MEFRVKLFPEGGNLFESKLVERLFDGISDEVDALFVLRVRALVVGRPVEAVENRKELFNGVGGGIAVNGVLFPLASLAEVVVLRKGPKIAVVELVFFLLQFLKLGFEGFELVCFLGGGFLLLLRGGGGGFFFFFHYSSPVFC